MHHDHSKYNWLGETSKFPPSYHKNYSQNVTEPSKGISYLVGDLYRRFTRLTGPSFYTLHSNLIPQQMVQMAFCDLSHTFHKQVTNVSQHVFVILLWGILTSPLNSYHGHQTSWSSCSWERIQGGVLGTPKLIKREKNVARVRLNTPRFSTVTWTPPPPPFLLGSLMGSPQWRLSI